MFATRKAITSALIAPLALALSACGGGEGGLSGDEIAAIPAPDGSDWLDTVTTTEEGGYKLGNPDAPINLIEYASHTCPACANFAVNGKDNVKEYVSTGVVSFEQREVLLGFWDLIIAGLSQCGPDTQYQPLSDEVWRNLGEVRAGLGANPQALQAVESLGPNERYVVAADAGGLINFFAARGLSADQARACLGDGPRMEALAESVAAQAAEDEVSGTPTFFLNGNRVNGISWDDVEAALQRAGARRPQN